MSDTTTEPETLDLNVDTGIEPEQAPAEQPEEPVRADVPVSTEILAARLLDLRDDNVRKLRELATHRRRPNPELVSATRLDSLLDLVLDDLGRIRFEMIFETRIAEMLEGALREARQAELLGGTGIGQPMPQMPARLGGQDSGPPPGGGLILPG